MIKFKNFLFLFVLLPTLLFAHKNECPYSLEDFDIDLDEETVVIKSDLMPGTVVRINEDYQLFIDDSQINLTKSEQMLVAGYYNHVTSLLNNAKKVGMESGKFAIKTITKLAANGLVAVLSSLFGEKDGEKDFERTEEEIKQHAAEIEALAEKLEKQAKELEELHCRLFTEVKALHQLIE